MSVFQLHTQVIFCGRKTTTKWLMERNNWLAAGCGNYLVSFNFVNLKEPNWNPNWKNKVHSELIFRFIL